tara:strand:- start:753 stop:2402 length:1650 start_codon:yes stop_codon:yes gene_type:complete
MSTNSKVLALKYRPVVFEDVVGQEIASETIFNSIKQNKIPNAYLFTGIRGVGKTTFARLVAKALNCKYGVEKLCKEKLCDSCHSISMSNHIDVLEMDAASKTGVDDVRELIDFSRYGPTSVKFKVFIIDEVHMLSKQAFNALLKTLEEPPEYKNGGALKFIFATTEIKKIPVTVLSRCQRFDLSRVKSSQLFEYIKKINKLENGYISDNALKLIVKISEGSVRDALSLLDRALLSNKENKLLELEDAQKIFGYFDKSNLITLFQSIFEADQEKSLNIYKQIYDQGVEPKIFLNDFLELLYYFKNIEYLSSEATSFDLNDEQYELIKNLSHKLDNQTLILFWQFTLKTLEELEIVADQNISIKMFIIRLIYIRSAKSNSSVDDTINKPENNTSSTKKDFANNDAINQIRNITQEKSVNKPQIKNNENKDIDIKNFNDLINLCHLKKEPKLKYELETNVNLVNFEYGRIEISFNEKLDKEFIKLLTSKLFEWTNTRWLISLTKEKGEKSFKDIKLESKKKLIDSAKKTETFKEIIEIFSDAELLEIEKKND